jgi:hypothetical protein
VQLTKHAPQTMTSIYGQSRFAISVHPRPLLTNLPLPGADNSNIRQSAFDACGLFTGCWTAPLPASDGVRL